MPNYLHRTTKRYSTSVSPADLLEPEANYIFMPDLSAVAGFPSKYWTITGDVVSLMLQSERDAVDAAILSASRDDQMAREVDELESLRRQVIKLMVDEFNILRQQFNATTAESAQLTTTTFADRTLAQVRTQLRNSLGS